MTNLPSSNIEYIIELTPLALAMLTNVKDQRELKTLSNRIDQLKSEPEKQGKPLVDKLQDVKAESTKLFLSYTKITALFDGNCVIPYLHEENTW